MEWVLSNQLSNNSSAMLCASTMIPKVIARLIGQSYFVFGYDLTITVWLLENMFLDVTSIDWTFWYISNWQNIPKQSLKFDIFEISIFNKITFLYTQNTMKYTF